MRWKKDIICKNCKRLTFKLSLKLTTRIKTRNCHMHLHTFTHLGAAAQCGRKRERADFHWLNLLEGNTLKIWFIFWDYAVFRWNITLVPGCHLPDYLNLSHFFLSLTNTMREDNISVNFINLSFKFKFKFKIISTVIFFLYIYSFNIAKDLLFIYISFYC